ncbi:glycosyltransferase family 2 protein [Candidatus Parcubacteria bacterium]|nr:MAG: glycosyltransferase family 2 protein [Candidatus Parcubacteria bacterium]
MHVSIILPAYNEEEAIGKVIDDVTFAMNNSSYKDEYEILVIDDVSQDSTAEIAQTKAARVIKRKVRGGSGASRKTGILESKGEIIVMLDADDTYTASDIPKMLEFFPEYDQVNGARDSEKGTIKFLRVPTKWVIRKIASYLTGVNIPDLNTGFKAFKKELMLKYMWVIPDGFSCVTTMTLAFLCNGHSVKYLPTNYKKRKGSSKFHIVKDTSKYLQTVIRMIIYFNPLKFFLPFFVVVFSIGILKVLVEFIWLSHRVQASSIIIILASVNIFFFGVIADLLVSQQKARNNA